ncbi:hypothetical protein RUM44_008712 [Polyplax serrata]|uniref:Mandelate racemase/muconate lactonizing enzyme C-terminal domain-containing protein n=1 Tax=Polyplax serrata TaxID=468196 RepID=A0ABR1B914_POLSC
MRKPQSEREFSLNQHTDPDYSCAYVIIGTKNGRKGYGLTFTLGNGTEIVVQAVHSMAHLILKKNAGRIFQNFARTWRELTSDSQLRWVGPEKGVVHLATAAIVNALWDLWARLEKKPLWKLLCDMDPETLVSTIDFRYITDLVTPDECVQFLNESRHLRQTREEELKSRGYPAYTTQVGWLGYSHDKTEALCKEFMKKGFSAFKIKVGKDVTEDIKRCQLVRRVIGPDNLLASKIITVMLDANQKWDVEEALTWMRHLTDFKPFWIEEPTSPDDILGHVTISKIKERRKAVVIGVWGLGVTRKNLLLSANSAQFSSQQSLNPLGVKVATGEMCANRVMFKQFLQAGGVQICQIDSARIGGVNEILAVYFMAKKLNVPVCPHAGGVGLCEMVRHLQFFDYICLTGSTEDRMIEFVDQQHEHFEDPALVRMGMYQLPEVPGYSCKFKDDVFEMYQFPNGKKWRELKKT